MGYMKALAQAMEDCPLPQEATCIHCGESLSGEEGNNLEAYERLKCLSCGAPIEEGTRWCSCCGEELGEDEEFRCIGCQRDSEDYELLSDPPDENEVSMEELINRCAGIKVLMDEGMSFPDAAAVYDGMTGPLERRMFLDRFEILLTTEPRVSDHPPGYEIKQEWIWRK